MNYPRKRFDNKWKHLHEVNMTRPNSSTTSADSQEEDDVAIFITEMAQYPDDAKASSRLQEIES